MEFPRRVKGKMDAGLCVRQKQEKRTADSKSQILHWITGYACSLTSSVQSQERSERWLRVHVIVRFVLRTIICMDV